MEVIIYSGNPDCERYTIFIAILETSSYTLVSEKRQFEFIY